VRAGREAVAELDLSAAVGDAIAALQTLRALPEVTDGRAGVIGFCFGTIAYEVAVNAGPDVAVVYYGSGIPAALDRAGAIACPTIMHWGGADPFIPREQVDAVAAMAAAHASIECHVHEGAGHAFDNHLAPMFQKLASHCLLEREGRTSGPTAASIHEAAPRRDGYDLRDIRSHATWTECHGTRHGT
jgi:carboxymethylenebutenolidase